MTMDENSTFSNVQTELKTNLTEDSYENIVLKVNRHVALGTLSLAIIINLIVCVIISTDKAMKNNHQRAIFLTISIDEIIVESMLIFVMFWTEGGIWCDIFFNVYMICRMTTYSLLLYLCLERLLAVYPDKNFIFQKFRSQNGRILYLMASLLLASMIYIPMSAFSSNGIAEPNPKGGCKSISYSRVSAITRFLLATYAVIILGIYSFLMRKIKNQHTKFPSKQSMRQSKKIYETKNFTTTVQIPPNVSDQIEMKQTTSAIPNPKTVFAIASIQKQENGQKVSGTSEKNGLQVDEGNSNHIKASNQRAWQKRANRVLRNAVLGITVPSILMVVLQIVLMALPNGDTKSIDIAVVTLLSVFSPAILYPFLFIFSVKGCKPRKT